MGNQACIYSDETPQGSSRKLGGRSSLTRLNIVNPSNTIDTSTEHLFTVDATLVTGVWIDFARLSRLKAKFNVYSPLLATV